ncbi:hypothetical protein, partial [Pseudarthrobacter sp. DSP2-3-2b1]|uniref:hypothetical protein n=1 Tax=Pseudarthrobacter sp. DSP2-3-2b1 TaxID=2804661 RepID=UPI003CF738DB
PRRSAEYLHAGAILRVRIHAYLRRPINSALEKPRETAKLDAALLDMWPRLDLQLKKISETRPPMKEARRSEKDMVTEILGTVRDIARQLPQANSGMPPLSGPPATKLELLQIRAIITEELEKYPDASAVALRHGSSTRNISITTTQPIPLKVQSRIRNLILSDFVSIRDVIFIEEGS